ncbi:MAG: PAS domain S-box protein [Deltaproteobacteria bacterium]|nr:PAS domain S-box protein [Deltaproteobacteria bacterium]
MAERKLEDEFRSRLTRQDHVQALEQKLQWELESRSLVIGILTLLNEQLVEIDVVRKIFTLVREFAGFEAVGIRMRQDGDFPYLFTDGLSDDFIEAENSLCARTKYGEIVCDSEGHPVLECICGQIIRDETDPSLPFFTASGSFWTNSRSKLLASRHGSRFERGVRKRFNSAGYESVALIPLRSSREVVGILQFNDKREDCFSPEMVLFFEAIGGIIGSVFARLRTEQSLRQARDELEERVQVRTAALSALNCDLEKEIEEREAAEQDLLLTQHRLQLAMEASSMTTWDWNVDTDRVYFDHRWSEMMGVSSEQTDANFDMWLNRLHRDDKLNVLKALKDHLEHPSQHFDAEYRARTATGDYRWLLDRGKVVECDEDGKALRMAGICLDITERKRMEEEVHESAERFRAIFESAKDCIFVKNSSLQYTEVNPAFTKMIDLREWDIVGKTDADLYDTDSAEILQDVDHRVLSGESVEQEHTRVIAKLRRTFLDTKVPMRNNRGDIVGIVGISMEITDRKRTQSDPPVGKSDSASPAMRSTLSAARLAAETDAIVLLMGESGAGKDHIARYIHDHSKRANGPFFSINCAAVSPELAESELFGYESGAFTGSKGPKRGLLELAEGGTILLNEIGELSLPLQAKLLTFLDTRQFTRVGGVKLFKVNARLMAATNRNLEKEVKLNRFRDDLFYRLNVFMIEVPPLRRRTEDMPHLVPSLLQELSSKLGLESVPHMEHPVLKALAEYQWPGNVRELRNVLERALILCDKKRITMNELAINNRARMRDTGHTWSVTIGFPENETINDVSMNVKRALVVEALRRTGGSRKRAADLLGISPDSLKHYMQIFDLYTIHPVPSRQTL